MRCRSIQFGWCSALTAVILLLLMLRPVSAGVEVSYVYRLSNFNGPIGSIWAGLVADNNRNEIYMIEATAVRIFNEVGMEIHRFNDDGSLGLVLDLAVTENGNILVISRIRTDTAIRECDFRGQPIDILKLQNLPSKFADFIPSRIIYRNGRLYLADLNAMQIAVFDANGRFEAGYDIAEILQLPNEKRVGTKIEGFSLAPNRDMLFTIPVLFKAYRLSPEGQIESFGEPGSAPGRFNIVSDIVADDQGYLYVADRLKSVVQVFDEDFRFQMQFGYRGPRRDNLIGPRYLVLDSRNRLYISQLRNRGVSVFRIQYTEP